MASRDDFERANQRGKDLQAGIPRAVAARYERKTGKIVIELSSKLTVTFSPNDAEGLESARPSQLTKIEISPSGFGLHFPAIDADLYVPGLLEGFMGSKSWMASRLGQIGGSSRSKAKKTASRANGRLGGRPKKANALVKTQLRREAQPKKEGTAVKARARRAIPRRRQPAH